MSIQFQRQFLMEDEVYKGLKDTLLGLGAGEQAANMLVKAVEQGALTPQEAVDITRATTTMEEEGSMAAAAGPTLEPVRVKKEIEEGDDSPAFKKGQEVTYLRHPAVITNVQKDMMGNWNYSVLYDKGTGKTKATNIYNKGGEIKPLKEDAPILAGGKIKDNYAVSQFGYKEAPRGHAKLKGIIVKDLWKVNEEYNMDKGSDYTIIKKGSKPIIGTFDSYRRDGAFLFRVNGDLVAIDEKDLESLKKLNENYHRFKKETATRTKAQQMHEAAKAIEKRLHEVNKLLEYTNELKSELFEGDDGSQMTHHTKKVFEKVTWNIAEAYSKLKKIK